MNESAAAAMHWIKHKHDDKKWILFFSMCAIVPVFYFTFVVGGFLPLLRPTLRTAQPSHESYFFRSSF